ncbi:MAG: pyridoxamine 5'-phosphate oxidase family protein [Acidimicrobiia bacterium]|nr:pyridoxamine 5'-phosphate oxidase family protein [Acidimicrobiia bacterium]
MEPLSEQQARRLLEEVAVAHIGVISDGEPYVTPMSFVVDGNRILFRTKPGKRFSAIEKNPTVSIEASIFDEDGGDWRSVIVKGTAAITDDPETARLTVEKLLRKYQRALGSPLSRGGIQPLASFPHIVAVEIEELSGMAASGAFSTRTRPGRL